MNKKITRSLCAALALASNTPATHLAASAYELREVARFGQCFRLQQLISVQIPVNEADITGLTALHWAAQNGHWRCVELLIRVAHVDALDWTQETPLHKAAWSGSYKCTQLLLNAGANPAAVNEFGQTPLDIAREKDFQAIIDILLDAAQETTNEY
ncbi:ankyrin repeat domain-containing protein [Candidatus Babeliales bacterium]|nr:ankyrin repeat domain-containing protein [Candidatus Babeliales bacterium]